MRKVWIDCDPGVDDAAALFLAGKMDMEIVGISSVAGNATHDNTFRNARDLVAMIGKDIPVYPGAEVPMIRELHTAPHVHGVDGLGGISLEKSDKKLEEKKAWDALYEAVENYGHDLEILCVGPLTNIGIALKRYPDIKQKIKRIIIMGGGVKKGNVTPAAEFNIYGDPEAADSLFASGIPVVMFGLDVTLQAYLTPEDLDEIGAKNSKQGKFIHDSFQLSWNFCKKYGFQGVAVHDACTVMYLEYPELFKLKKAWVRVETKGDVTLGKTVCDLYSDKKMPEQNIDVALEVDREKFVEKVKMILARYE